MSSIRVALASIVILSVGLTGPVQSYGTAKAGLTQVDTTTKTVLTLRRVKTHQGTIIGKLYLNNDLECYTLESDAFKIPLGTYKISRQWSEKFKKDVIKLHGVPGRSGIEIHPGNTKEDAKGCILVGVSHTDKSVVASRGTLTQLLKRLQFPAVIELQDAQL